MDPHEREYVRQIGGGRKEAFQAEAGTGMEGLLQGFVRLEMAGTWHWSERLDGMSVGGLMRPLGPENFLA